MIKQIKLLILLLTITGSTVAQQHTDQNGLKTTVTDVLSASNAQALRYEIATLGFNSYHWQYGGLVIIELFSPYHNTGYEKYILNVGSGTGVGSGSPALTLVETAGNLHVAKITLGTAYDLQTNLGGYVNKALSIYMDIRYYARYRARITYQQDKVNVVDNHNQIKIDVSPVAQTIPDFVVSTVLNNPITSSKNLMIEGSGNHYISNGNFGIGTITPDARLSLKMNSFDSNGGLKMYGFNYPADVNYWGEKELAMQYNGVFKNVIANNGVSYFNGGNVGIGTETPSEKLSVNGKIRAKEIRVEPNGWPDYVFEDGYQIETLTALESYIKTNKHLPEIPSAKEVGVNGIEVGEMNKILLKKIEELTLYLIEIQKENSNLKDRITKLEQNH